MKIGEVLDTEARWSDGAIPGVRRAIRILTEIVDRYVDGVAVGLAGL